MNLTDYSNGAVDAMLSHRYGNLPADVQQRPLTPMSSSEKDNRSRCERLKPGATAAMIQQRYTY